MKCKACGGVMVARGTRETRPFMIRRRTVHVYRCARCKREEELVLSPSEMARRLRPILWKCVRCGRMNEHHRKKCIRCGRVVGC